MDEGSLESTPPDRVTEFVLKNVDSFEELNAGSLKEGHKQFRKALIKALEKQTAGEEVGRGGQFLVNRLRESKGIVIKRLRGGEKMDLQGNLTTDEYFRELRRQHKTVHKYFGDRFIPRTEFVEVDSNFDDPNPPYFKVQPGHEYVMVQEEIDGEEVSYFLMRETRLPTIFTALKESLREFVRCYRSMMCNERAVIENQFYINFETGEVKVSDTNHYPTYDDYVRDNGLLNELGINPDGVNSAEEILEILTEHLPELSLIKGLPYSTAIETLDFRDELYGKACNGIADRYSDDEERKEKALSGFKKLLRAAEYFPPEGEDNVFIRNVIRKFKLGRV